MAAPMNCTRDDGEKPCDPNATIHIMFFVVPLMILLCCFWYGICKHGKRRREIVIDG